ncbi:MAG: type 4a pilus biogenesis protein PilO [Actinobacteria bacterium]|nr:type 4a pilus biogenesis protein PilO [Actinomycetota bacterium]
MSKLKTLPQPAQFALVAVAALLVIAVGYMALLAPKQKQISSLKAQTSAATQQYAAAVAPAATDSGSSAPQINVADIYKLTTAMPSVTDMPDLLIELNSTAKAAGVSLQSIAFSPLAPSADGTYSDIPITLQATGNFYTITDLVYRLRNLVYVRDGALQANGRIFSISSIALTPGGQNLNAAITLDTYVYGSKNEAAAVPGSTSTTPTSTTPGTTTPTTTTTTPPPTSGATAAGATG